MWNLNIKNFHGAQIWSNNVADANKKSIKSIFEEIRQKVSVNRKRKEWKIQYSLKIFNEYRSIS